LPHLAKVKSLSNLLKAEAIVYSEAGQVDMAVHSIVDSFGLARALESEPLLISQLVRNACLMISCSALERLINQHALPEAQLKKLLRVVRDARSASSASFQGGYMGELCVGVFCFEGGSREMLPLLTDSGSEISPWVRVAYPIYAWSGLRDRDFLFYLRTMHTLLENARAPLPERLAKTKALGNQTEQVLKLRKLLIYSGMLLPSLQRSTERATETEGHLRATEAALLVELYRSQQSGAPPADLAQLASAGEGALVDPVDGAPLRYRKLDSGYLVYSIGVDGTDQDGQDRRRPGRAGNGRSASNSSSRTGGYDVVFRVDRE
jgi:hypothetical protein